MLTLKTVEEKLKKSQKIGLKCCDAKGFIDYCKAKSGWFGEICAESILGFNPLVVWSSDGTFALIENRLVGIHKDQLQFFQLDSSVPLYSNGWVADVGHNVKRANSGSVKEIIRIDTSTRQVWFKKGGFEWFEDMKNYSEV